MGKIIFTAAMLAAGLVRAGEKGTSAAGFLKTGAGARAAAMGEAQAAVVEGAAAIYWNPAALARLSRRSVTLSHVADVESTSSNFAAYAQPAGKEWGLGIGVQHQTAGSLTRRDAGGFETGSFTPTDTAFALGLARRAGPAFLGVSAKWVRTKIVDTAATAAADIGLLWPVHKNAMLALTATNLGGKIKYDRESEDLPTAYRAGLGFRPSGRWVLGLDVAAPRDNDAYVAAGAEAWMVKNERFSLAARGGYNTRSSGDVDGLTGATAGLGFRVRGLGVDYAFVPMGDLGQAHRMSLSYSF